MPLRFIEIPEDFLCSITQEIMSDPVFTADGETYDRAAITLWLTTHDTSPNTNEKLSHQQLTPNRKLKSQIQAFVEKQRDLFTQELLAAAKGNEKDTLKLVLSLGISKDVQDEQGWTALHHAVFQGYKCLIPLLADSKTVNQASASVEIEANPRLQARAQEQLTALAAEKEKLNSPLIVANLQQALQEYDRLHAIYQTKITHPDAPQTEMTQKIKQNLEQRHDSILVQLILSDMIPVHQSHIDMATLRDIILKKGEDFDESKALENEERLLAIKKQLLPLRHYAPYYSATRVSGCSPLVFAIYRQEWGIVDALLLQEPDLTQRDSQGFTLLHWAARVGQLPFIKSLLAKGIVYDVKDQRGKTPLDIAHIFYQTDAAIHLEQATLSSLKSPDKKNVSAMTFFASVATPTIDPAAVDKLLLHVARGEQDEAEALLKIKGNDALLLHKGRVTDYSDRTFINITAFQLALWALDWHMWKMLKDYLPSENAKAQLEELEAQGTAHGKHYDFKPLLQALQTYVDNYAPWSVEQRRDHWCKVVGGEQTRLPSHAAQAYCGSVPFHPTPTFTDEAFLRTLTLYGDTPYFPLSTSRGGRLGVDFGVYKGGGRGEPGPRVTWGGVHAGDGHEVDLVALTTLCKVRTAQLADLTRELALAPAQRPGLSA